jgi:hypothetical protein
VNLYKKKKLCTNIFQIIFSKARNICTRMQHFPHAGFCVHNKKSGSCINDKNRFYDTRRFSDRVSQVLFHRRSNVTPNSFRGLVFLNGINKMLKQLVPNSFREVQHDEFSVFSLLPTHVKHYRFFYLLYPISNNFACTSINTRLKSPRS